MPVYSDAQPTFQPAMRTIAGISQSGPMVITTDLPHFYLDGLTVRLIVPSVFGMWQANDLQGEIVVIDATNFSMSFDSTGFSAFVIPAGNIRINAQVVPFAENAHILTQAEQNVLPY